MTVKSRKPLFYGYVIVLCVFVLWMAVWGIDGTYGVFFKPMVTEFGWTRAEGAGARALTSGILGVASILSGRLTDKLGPRRVTVVFGAIFILGLLLMPHIQELWQFYLVYGVIVGTGMSAAGTPSLSLIAHWFVKRRGLMAGIVQGATGVGGLILAPVAAWLIGSYGWRFGYMVLALAGLVLVFISAIFLKKEPADIGQRPYGYSVDSEQPENAGVNGITFRESIRTRQFWILSLTIFGFGFCRTFTLTHYVAHVTDLGYSLATGAGVAAVISIMGFLGRIIMGRFADKYGNKPSLIFGFAFMAGSFIWAIYADQLWMMYVFAVIFGIGWGTVAVTRILCIAETFGLGSLGLMVGVIDFAGQIGAVFGPLMGGWLFDITGTYTLSFIISGIVAVLGLLLATRLNPVTPPTT